MKYTRQAPPQAGVVAHDKCTNSPAHGAKSLYLVEPDPSGFKPLASAELLGVTEPENEFTASRFATQNWAPIALADGRLLIRDQNRLMCVKVAE